jgi:hypothetical protein
MYGGEDMIGNGEKADGCDPGTSRFDVIVPVFLKVTLNEADELAAEVCAEQIVSALGVLEAVVDGRKVRVSVQSVMKTVTLLGGGQS